MLLERGEGGFCGPLGWGVWADRRELILTPCFEDSLILMVPKLAMFFWGALELKSRGFKRPLDLDQRTKLFFKLKLAAIGVLILFALVNTILGFARETIGTSKFTAITNLFAFSYAFYLHYYLHARSKRPSTVLTLFWLFFFFASIVKLRGERALDAGNESLYDPDGYSYYLLWFSFPFMLATFVLESIPKIFEKREGLLAEAGEDEESSSTRKPCPEEDAGILSRLSFWWMNPLMMLGYQKPLTEADLWEINDKDKAGVISDKFQKAWAEELENKNPSLVRAFVKSIGAPFLIAGVFKFMQDTLAFIQPQLLKALIEFIYSFQGGLEPQPVRNGFVIAGLMFFVAVIQSAVLHQYFHRCFSTGMRLRSAVVTAIYQKSLRLSPVGRQKFTVGETVNLMSVDAQRLMDLCTYLHVMWSGPFQIIMALYFLYQVLGWSIFAGVAVMVLMIPANTFIASKSRAQQKIQMGNKDARIKTMDELLSGMKVIKLYAWEDSFLAKILRIRDLEMWTLKKIAMLSTISSFFWTTNSFFIGIATFGVYTGIAGLPLTSDKTFVSLSLFNLLQFPMVMFPSVITSCVEASVALKRISDFLLGEELQPDAISRSSTATAVDSDTPAIEVHNATFTWDRNATRPTLSDISFRCKQGQLVAVVGKVGSGKSSLISAILGEMTKESGRVATRGRVAYVPQQAWIMNATLRDNITFGKTFNHDLYNETIENCALRPDLAMLPGGDATEIGEKGINLSGGQKQRISIARAVYNDADVFLFDDPLSAVDAHVGKHIFTKVLSKEGALQNKARLLVTNAVQFLPKVDLIIVLEQGRIAEIGTYEELIQARKNFYTLVSEYGSKVKEEDEPKTAEETPTSPSVVAASSPSSPSSSSSSSSSSSAPAAKAPAKDDKLIGKEEQQVGSVSMEVYKEYAKSTGYGGVVLIAVLFVLTQTVQVGSNFWLSHWSNEASDTRVGYYLGIYAMFGILQSIFVIATFVTFALFGIKAARYLHDQLLHSVLAAPMSFFDTTPLGRILNRFSKDQYTVDETLPSSFQSYFRTSFNVVSIFIVIIYTTPLFILGVIPLGVIYFYVQRYYIATSRELKRLDSVKRSPIYSHFSETLSGATTIRAYEFQQRFIAENEHRLNDSQKAYYPSIASNRWLATRLEFIGNAVVLMAGVFAVLSHGKIDAGQVGLSITYALSITQTLNWMVRQSCEIETNIVSVERIKEYIDIKHERSDFQQEVNTTWPEQGMIEFKNYATAYREGLSLVLQDISCRVRPREKVGIVGRTGAGKSSITLALFRLIEPVRGDILIDNVDITRLRLKDLRSRITIIPQDPVLFAGTVRENLDPFNRYSDAEIWAALASSHLKDHISSMELGLSAPVAQGGENLSVGQRQLICLARALLRKTRILVLDEATAAIDIETDDFIQRTIRKEFADCTIITIAHRLNTIIDSDRILVLDRGRIQEFDTPANLLQNPSSLFYSLAREAGLV